MYVRVRVYALAPDLYQKSWPSTRPNTPPHYGETMITLHPLEAISLEHRRFLHPSYWQQHYNHNPVEYDYYLSGITGYTIDHYATTLPTWAMVANKVNGERKMTLDTKPNDYLVSKIETTPIPEHIRQNPDIIRIAKELKNTECNNCNELLPIIADILEENNHTDHKYIKQIRQWKTPNDNVKEAIFNEIATRLPVTIRKLITFCKFYNELIINCGYKFVIETLDEHITEDIDVANDYYTGLTILGKLNSIRPFQKAIDRSSINAILLPFRLWQRVLV